MGTSDTIPAAHYRRGDVRRVTIAVLLFCSCISLAQDKKPPKIQSGAKIYVAPINGYENYIIAGIMKKNVPVVIVNDRSKADFEIRGSTESDKAGWAKMLFLGSQQSNEQASIYVEDVHTLEIVYGYSVNKVNSVRGKQSTGEAIGKHLKEIVGKD